MGSHGIKDRVAIVGMGCTNFVEHWDKGLDDLVIDAADSFAVTYILENLGILIFTSSPRNFPLPEWLNSAFQLFDGQITFTQINILDASRLVIVLAVFLDIDRRHPEAVPAIIAGVTVGLGLVIDVLWRDRHDFEQQQRLVLGAVDRLPELTAAARRPDAAQLHQHLDRPGRDGRHAGENPRQMAGRRQMS